MQISKQIEERIKDAPFGEAFIISDFTDITSYDTARKTLARLEADKLIIKITRGLYYKPKFSKLLNEPIAPNINTVAEAIARNYEWSITPSGENALNLLGISTQVPGRYSYISSGPYRTYMIGNIELEFLHRTDKDLNGKSYKTRMIIQAIKSIGQKRIDEYILDFKSKLTSDDLECLLKEGQRTTAWVYAAIKKIAVEELYVPVS